MVRSLSRGLKILTLLNRRDSASVGELAKDLEIPRATVYRIIATLREENFVYQHHADHRFRAMSKVRELSDGFTVEDHMVNIAQPFLSQITQKLVWPVSLGTLSGVDMVVRENTDDQSPLATERFTIGYRMPILTTASGLCVLAHLKPARRAVLLETLARADPHSVLTKSEAVELESALREIKKRGFSVYHRHRAHSDAISISVPVLQKMDKIRGALTIRFAKRAVKLPVAIATFVPVLRTAAEGIAERIDLHLNKQQMNFE